MKNDGPEFLFRVEPDPGCGLIARAVDHAIFIEGDSVEELKFKSNARDAIYYHFDDPTRIKLRFEFTDPRPV